MITLIITLFVIALIEFGIFLILEFTSIKNNKQKLNEHDKLYNDDSRDICGDSQDSRQSDKTE